MAAQAAANSIEPSFGVGDRMEKSRRWCGIKSAQKMADRLNERLGPLDKPIKASTVSAWEAGTNQPTMIRMEELIPLWVSICNEAGEPIGRATSAAFIYGVQTGDQNRKFLTSLPAIIGQGSLLDDDLVPVEFYSRPFLAAV